MRLYWHRWKTKRGLIYLLFDKPQTHDDTVRSTGEIAIVHRLNGYWRGEINQVGKSPSLWLHTGSPLRSRRLIENQIARRSGAMFDGEDIEFCEPQIRE